MTLQEAWSIWRDRRRGFYFPDRIALAREVLVLNGAPVDEL